MYDALGVREGDGLADFHHDGERARQVPALRLTARQIDDLAEVAALHESHGEVDPAARVHADVVDRDDPGVLELRRDLGLLEEPGERGAVDLRGGLPRRLVPAVGTQDLHRERAVELSVANAKDDTHAAARQLAVRGVATRRPVGRRVVGGSVA